MICAFSAAVDALDALRVAASAIDAVRGAMTDDEAFSVAASGMPVLRFAVIPLAHDSDAAAWTCVVSAAVRLTADASAALTADDVARLEVLAALAKRAAASRIDVVRLAELAVLAASNPANVMAEVIEADNALVETQVAVSGICVLSVACATLADASVAEKAAPLPTMLALMLDADPRLAARVIEVLTDAVNPACAVRLLLSGFGTVTSAARALDTRGAAAI